MVRRETYWTTITDCNGAVEQELSYDAWGNLRDPNTWRRFWYDPVYEEPMFDRGYTGHEHITAFGLINMNGRCYDPVMSSFLSVDAFVQSPDNSQSFNRYAYCMNNPLKYTDPSGWVMLGGMTHNNPFHDTWGQNFGEKIYTSTEVRQMLWSMDISFGIWMVGNEMHGSRGGDGGEDNKCFFGYGDPNAVKVMGPGACVFASLGEICIRLGKMSMKPKYWKDKEVEYYNMKNAGGEENEENHGYNSSNIVDFVQWVSLEENINIDIQQIFISNIADLDPRHSQVLILMDIEDKVLIERNGGESGHAAVVNTFFMGSDGSIEMKFGDPSPQRVLPLLYKNKFTYGYPEGLSGWNFYSITIYKP